MKNSADIYHKLLNGINIYICATFSATGQPNSTNTFFASVVFSFRIKCSLMWKSNSHNFQNSIKNLNLAVGISTKQLQILFKKKEDPSYS